MLKKETSPSTMNGALPCLGATPAVPQWDGSASLFLLIARTQHKRSVTERPVPVPNAPLPPCLQHQVGSGYACT